MQRIQTLLNKISELSNKQGDTDIIEIDLMLDYTKVLYADLLEWKSKTSFTSSLEIPDTAPVTESTITNTEQIPSEEPEPSITPQTKEEPINQYQHQPERKNINKYIGINDKYQYISELFGNDKERYESVLNNINTFDNTESAINWLQTEIRTEQNWSDDIESVQMFYDTVNSFFSSK